MVAVCPSPWFAASVLVAVATFYAPSIDQRAAISSLLDLYDHGDYAAVARQLESIEDVRELDRLDAELKDSAKTWIQAAGPSAERRRAFVAGAFSLELTRALVEHFSPANDRFDNHSINPEALPHIKRLIAERGDLPDAIEREWTLAQLATWQIWNAGARVIGPDLWITPEPVWALLLGQPSLSQLSRSQRAFGNGGYLAEALARFPDESRLLLARTEGVESMNTRCAVSYCFDEMTPNAVDQLRHRTKDRPGRTREMAAANLAAFDRLLPVATAFASLAAAHPDVRAEANVHIGYLAIRAARPDAALTPLATAAASEDPYVRYLAEYFTGRALAALGRRPDAASAYRRALAVVPNAPSAATLLAGLLMLSDDADDRLEAFTVLQSANAASPRPLDPWDLYWYGDARCWPVYVERLRKALQQ